MSSPPTAPKKGVTKWLVVGAGVLAVAGSGVVFQRSRKPAPEESAQPPKKAPVFEPGVVDLDPFVLNLADPAGDRYFRLNLRLVLDQRAIAERAADERAQVKLRDRILSLLAKKRAAQMATQEGRESLRTELATLTEPLFADAPFHDPETDAAPARVIDVLFTEFLVQ